MISSKKIMLKLKTGSRLSFENGSGKVFGKARDCEYKSMAPSKNAFRDQGELLSTAFDSELILNWVGTVMDISFNNKNGLTVVWSYGVDRYAQRFDCTHDRFMKIPNQFKISIDNVVEYLSSVQHHVEHWLET